MRIYCSAEFPAADRRDSAAAAEGRGSLQTNSYESRRSEGSGEFAQPNARNVFNRAKPKLKDCLQEKGITTVVDWSGEPTEEGGLPCNL